MFNIMPWRRKDAAEWQPQRTNPVDTFRDEINSLMDQFFGRSLMPRWDGWGLDVQDNDKTLVVRAEAPGFETSDFDVQVSGNTLTITAEHKTTEDKDKNFFSQRSLQRTMSLPTVVDPNQVEAKYRNGILELTFTKKPDAQAKKIPVKQ